MRIRTQLVLLVLAVITPVALLAALATVGLWDLQREAYGQRFLERVIALRVALDTELDASLRQLYALGEALATEGDEASVFTTHVERLLFHYPAWSIVGLLSADGSVRASMPRKPELAGARPDALFIAEMLDQQQAKISNLSEPEGAPGTYLTFLALPISREGVLRGIVYLGIESTAWLEFFQRYPVGERATLTLNDRNGRIIARTLDNSRWVGRSSTPQYWQSTLDRDQGTLVNVGVDGTRFYSAFSRSRTASWIVGTGVPQDEVEAAFSRPTLSIVFGVLAAGGLATVFAYFLGGRITGALTSLASSVRSLAAGERRVPPDPLPIEEAETVRRALIAGARLLAGREASLNEALEREARARAEAESASRAKDDLLAMLGHELRNPINAIKAAASVLDMDGVKPEVGQRARDVVQRQIGHLTSIVNDLLDVARLDSGKAQLDSRPLDLAAVARHVVETFIDTGRCRGLALETNLAPAHVIGDETRLEQIISNLLDNACKYTPPGRGVSIRVGVEDGSGVLVIRDSGSGISPEVLPKIFELFAQGARTLDRAQGGLGLGLTVVRRLVELHGGTISAASEGLDRGATFVVRLPLAQGEAEARSVTGQPMLAPLGIAVIEDNADNRHLVAEMLRMHGHRVSEADDGVRGVEVALAGDVDVALIDIGLPGWDGFEVARRLRASPAGARLCLIALTGYGRDEDRASALEAGFDGFLVKPFELAQFTAMVEKWRAREAWEPALATAALGDAAARPTA